MSTRRRIRARRSASSLTGAVLAVLAASCGDDLRPHRVLFVRGGAGTGGLGSGIDAHLSDIHDGSVAAFNTGYGQLAALLRDEGYEVEQVEEGPAGAPVALGRLVLSAYQVVVFGSNNAGYGPGDAALVARYVRGGGGALFISDGNWGVTFGAAPTSDQAFLTQFGLTMNQDGGGLTILSGADFVEPEHPILRDVHSIQGEGVSPCTLTGAADALARPLRLVAARSPVRRNEGDTGPVTAATADDASLTVVEVGRGRVACHFDRNTFFNEGGAGTSLAAADHRTYARNLFAYLAGR